MPQPNDQWCQQKRQQYCKRKRNKDDPGKVKRHHHQDQSQQRRLAWSIAMCGRHRVSLHSVADCMSGIRPGGLNHKTG